MSVNSSSPTNATVSLLFQCFDFNVNIFMSLAFTVTKCFLVLPLSIFLLCLGHQRWRQQRSFDTTSHSDFFTFQMAFLELISELGWGVYCCGFYLSLQEVTIVGFYTFFMVFPGQIFFHTLTCVERYLAVVHPITYRGLRQSDGVRIRNISTGCVWLLCLGWIGVITVHMPEFPIFPFFSLLIFSLLVVSFCSLSVLHVLIRPGPGEAGKDRERVDQSKQRAFYTIVTILAVLWLLFVGFLVSLALLASPKLNNQLKCTVLVSVIWFNLPSCFVLPLLFLHRRGKLSCCRSSPE